MRKFKDLIIANSVEGAGDSTICVFELLILLLKASKGIKEKKNRRMLHV